MTDEVSPRDDHNVPVTTSTDNGTGEPERCCWICYATDQENHMGPWVKPCQCRGSTKWVHQSCLYRWIDEKLSDESSSRTVSCLQCQTEYILELPKIGKIGRFLEILDHFLTRICPFLTAGIFLCSLYWSAATFGAVSLLQAVGHDNGMAIMQNTDPLLLLIGLPIIPIGLILGRLIRWEDVVYRMFQGRRLVDEEFEQQGYIRYPNELVINENVCSIRILCGALILPTISSIVGRIFFDSVKTTLHRTLLGGLTFITVKGFLKIYLRYMQLTSRRNRVVVDYPEENNRTNMPQNKKNNNNNDINNNNNTGGNADRNNNARQQQQLQGNRA